MYYMLIIRLLSITLLFFLPFNIYSQDINYNEIQKGLERMYELDQKYRKLEIEYAEKYGEKSPEVQSLADSFKYNDSVTHHYVDSIIKNYSWISKEKIGDDAASALFLVVQHSSLSYQLSILDIIKDARKKGALHPIRYAYITDRIKVRQNKKQKYGTQTKYYGDKLYIAPCIKKRTLNKRRVSIGLDTIEDYIKDMESTFNTKIYGIK